MRYGIWRLKRIAREITKEEMNKFAKKKKKKDRFQQNEKQIYVIKKKKKKKWKPKSDKHGEEAKQEVKLT